MNLKKYIISLLMLTSTQVFGQNIVLRMESGLGKFAMDDFRSLNASKLTALQFPAKLTSDFPSYLYYKPSAGVVLSNVELGLSCGYQSTGSRISAFDYSGEYRFDITLHSFTPAAYASFKATKVGPIGVNIGFTFGAEYSKFKSSEFYLLQGEGLKNELFRSSVSNLFSEPSVIVSYPYNSFGLSFTVSYYISIADDPVKITTIEQNFMGTFTRVSKYETDWSGYRVGLSLSYTFMRESKK